MEEEEEKNLHILEIYIKTIKEKHFLVCRRFYIKLVSTINTNL